MKKLLFIACVFLASCASKESKLISQAESFIRSGMGDPSSFSSINGKIIDTITNRGSIMYKKNVAMRDLETLIKSGGSDGFDYDTFNKTDSIYKAQIAAIKIDSPFYVTIHLNFRAKNGFGAMVVSDQYLKYYLNKKTFEVL